MKILLFVFVASLLLISCHSNTESAKSQIAHEHALKSTGNQLYSDNGKKWKTDEATRSNVQELGNLANKGLKEGPSHLISYHVFADTLATGLNKLISECTMKGPAHDALHVWLEPFMKTVREMKNAEDTTTAITKLADIRKQLDEYFNYFD